MYRSVSYILRSAVVLILTICSMSNSYAQDSLYVTPKKHWLNRVGDNKVFLSVISGAPLLGIAALNEKTNDKFRALRNQYTPNFSTHIDDYLLYTPMLALAGMKMAGVKSRSSWGRLIVSDALALSLELSSVNMVKNNYTYWRPDLGGPNSFPSGHTANAFMMASMFAKEYGHISPWLTAGAYSIATSTGVMRMANNRHWIRDVIMGAGIGILSTEIGYLIADAIFKEKGLNIPDNYLFNDLSRPSFFSIFFGKNIPLSGYPINQDTPFGFSSGTAMGIEGAYFFNRYIGAGARFSVSSTRAVGTDPNNVEADLLYYFMSFSDCMYYSLSFSPGLYVSKSLGNRWLLGGKLLGDYVAYPTMKNNGTVVPHDHGFGFGTGASITFRARPNYGLKMFADLNVRPAHSLSETGLWTSITCGFAFSFLCP